MASRMFIFERERRGYKRNSVWIVSFQLKWYLHGKRAHGLIPKVTILFGKINISFLLLWALLKFLLQLFQPYSLLFPLVIQ